MPRSFVAEDVFHGFIAAAPFEYSLRALATKTRMGRDGGAWWRRPQAGKEHSSPTLPSPGGLTPSLRRRTLPCPCGVRSRVSDCPIAVTCGWRLQATICRRCAAREGSCDPSHRGNPCQTPYRSTPVIVAIAVTRGWLTRAMLPGHSEPPCIPPSYVRGDVDFAAASRNNTRTNGNQGQLQLFITPVRGTGVDHSRGRSMGHSRPRQV